MTSVQSGQKFFLPIPEEDSMEAYREPQEALPLTSVVTIVGYGEALDFQVHFHHGETRHISQMELPDYITEKGNPRNRKGVREEEIAFPSEYLRDGVRKNCENNILT
jgi:hypothetical protein